MRAENNRNLETQFDCDGCQRLFSRQARARVQCGLVPPDERGTSAAWKPQGAPDATVCAGWSSRLPEVIEAARAMAWRDAGSLRDNYDVPITQLLRDAVDVLATEQAAANGYRMRRPDRGAK